MKTLDTSWRYLTKSIETHFDFLKETTGRIQVVQMTKNSEFGPEVKGLLIFIGPAKAQLNLDSNTQSMGNNRK